MTTQMISTQREKYPFRLLSDFAIMDVVDWGVAVGLLVVMALLPWLEMRDGTSYSALQLMSTFVPQTRLHVHEWLLLPFFSVLVLFGVMSVQILGRLPLALESRLKAFTVLIGFTCLLYFPLVIMRDGLSIRDTLEGTGIGFDLLFWSSLFLIAQGLMSRKLTRRHLVRPTAADGRKIGYLTRIGNLLRDDLFGRNVVWLIMCLPSLVWVFVFKYLTMYGLLIAFQDYKPRLGIEGSAFVGFQNFTFLFQTDAALRATRNTVLLNLLFIIVGTMFALLVAALLFEVYTSFVTRFYQTALLLPNFISWVIVSYFVFALLNQDGVINTFLASMGIAPVNWYNSPQYWPFILLLSSLWHSVGFSSLVYLAGMLGIDPTLYDASRVDGASKWQQFRHVTIPLLVPLVIINLLLALGNIFSADFGLFFQVTRDTAALYPTTDVLDTFIYRSLIVSPAGVRLAAAAQVYQSIVGFVLVVFANWLVRRLSPPDEDLSLF